MFKIKIPLTMLCIEIFIGVEEIPKYNRIIKKMGCSKPITEKDIQKNAGLAYGSVIWVEEFAIGILLHEISHAMDVITDKIGCENEDEFKAYIWGYIGVCLEKEYVRRINKNMRH